MLMVKKQDSNYFGVFYFIRNAKKESRTNATLKGSNNNNRGQRPR